MWEIDRENLYYPGQRIHTAVVHYRWSRASKSVHSPGLGLKNVNKKMSTFNTTSPPPQPHPHMIPSTRQTRTHIYLCFLHSLNHYFIGLYSSFFRIYFSTLNLHFSIFLDQFCLDLFCVQLCNLDFLI